MKDLRLLVLLCLSFPVLGEETPKFEKGSNCVAWKAIETMFLFSESAPVGMNCDIQAQFVDKDGMLSFEGVFPIKKFRSDDENRDEEIFGKLKGEVQPEILFKSESLPAATWKSYQEAGSATIKGKIRIGGVDYPLECPVGFDKMGADVYLVGFVKTSFSGLGLEVPSVLGGVVASVEDYLELHYNIKVAGGF